MLSSTLIAEDEGEILVDEAQPVRAGRGSVAEIERSAVDLGNAAGVGLVIAGQQLDQGGLPRPVLADERPDLAVLQVKLRRGAPSARRTSCSPRGV